MTRAVLSLCCCGLALPKSVESGSLGRAEGCHPANVGSKCWAGRPLRWSLPLRLGLPLKPPERRSGSQRSSCAALVSKNFSFERREIAMKIPGFTAEASLTSRAKGYWTSQVVSPAHSTVLPAAPLPSACAHICYLADQCNLNPSQDDSLCQAWNYICHGVCTHSGGNVACLVNCLESGGKVTQCLSDCRFRAF
jgi:hypothetical protein